MSDDIVRLRMELEIYRDAMTSNAEVINRLHHQIDALHLELAARDDEAKQLHAQIFDLEFELRKLKQVAAAVDEYQRPEPGSIISVMDEVAHELKTEGVTYDAAAIVRSLDEDEP